MPKQASTSDEAFLFWSPLDQLVRGQIGDKCCEGDAPARLVLSSSTERICRMASLELHYGSYRVLFRFSGRKFCRSLKTANPKIARSVLARLEDNLVRLELGQLIMPQGADVASFLLSDGRLDRPQQLKLSDSTRWANCLTSF